MLLAARDKSPSQQAAHRHHKAPCVVNVSGMGVCECLRRVAGALQWQGAPASLEEEEEVSSVG